MTAPVIGTLEEPKRRNDDGRSREIVGVWGSIRGEKRCEREEKAEHRRHVERSFGAFSRSFTLPSDADAEHIDASFNEGALTVEIRKTEPAKTKRIDIKG
jgi:HSP20 family protein